MPATRPSKSPKRRHPAALEGLARALRAVERRLARMEERLDELAQAREDADDVAAARAAIAEGPTRPYDEVRRELGLA